MAGRGQGGKKGTNESLSLSLSAQTHQQILDYLKVAEDSTHPEIRDTAVQLAKDASEHQRKQTARLQPATAAMLSLLTLALAGASIWYFFVHYSERVATIMSVMVFGLAIIGVCLLAMVSNHLSQANFVKLVEAVWSKIVGSLWGPRAKHPESPEREKLTSNDD
jgi:lipopolysaccharide export LptBFGC system permease protein LptF